MQLSGKRLKTAVSDFGHLAGLPFLPSLVGSREQLAAITNKHKAEREILIWDVALQIYLYKIDLGCCTADLSVQN